MEKITDVLQLNPKKQYTYADYLTWQFKDRVELIKGLLYKMSPAPKRRHQSISLNLASLLWNNFKGQGGKVFEAPFDVRLTDLSQNPPKENTVVQPDICVICDIAKLDDYGCKGAPDLIVEVLSETTAKKDYNEKFNLYEQNGVKEYWLANPDTNTIEIYCLENEKYQLHGIFSQGQSSDVISGKLFPDFSVSLTEVFQE